MILLVVGALLVIVCVFFLALRLFLGLIDEADRAEMDL
jgi:hypothetical protein